MSTTHSQGARRLAGALMLTLAAAAAAACGDDARAAAASAGDALDATPVRTAPVETVLAAEPVRATGVAAGRDEARLAFKVGGVVARVLVREGDAVRAGQPLALLDPVEIDARVSRVASAAAQAERDLARVRALHRDSVATLAQLEQAATAASVAAAELRAARFDRRHATVVAPSAGVVLRRLVEPSELVAAGQPVLIARGAAGGTVLRVGLADRDAVRVALGDSATVRFDAHPGETFAARVTEMAAAAAAGTGTYEVELTIDARGRALASGLVGRAEIAVRGGAPVALVPIEALVEADGDSGTVFTVDGGRARRRSVSVAWVRDGRAAVREGLDGVARVVTDGAAYLVDGATVREPSDATPGTPAAAPARRAAR